MIVPSTVQPTLTLEEFLALPETKPYAEYLDGNVEPKPMPQGEHSILQIRLGTTINQVALPQKQAHAFTELRCNIQGRSLVPDISVFVWDRIPKTAAGKIANRIDTYPDWVIEILSPDQSANQVIKKIMVCLQAGTQLAWLIDPADESVLVLKPQQFPELKANQDSLPVLESLSILTLSAQDLFSWLSLG